MGHSFGCPGWWASGGGNESSALLVSVSVSVSVTVTVTVAASTDEPSSLGAGCLLDISLVSYLPRIGTRLAPSLPIPSHPPSNKRLISEISRIGQRRHPPLEYPSQTRDGNCERETPPARLGHHRHPSDQAALAPKHWHQYPSGLCDIRTSHSHSHFLPSSGYQYRPTSHLPPPYLLTFQ